MEDASDEDLMARVAAGDEEAFCRLARRNARLGFGLARRLTGSTADAEDVVQEALLRVWTHAPRWRPTAAFRTWFYRVVVNLCLDRRRRRAWVALEEADEPADPGPDAVALIERDETGRAVAAAVAGLPDRQRAALLLTYYEGLSNAETAVALATSVSAVETLLVRAKRALRRRLSPLRDERKEEGKDED
ncbi:MAG: sigma-70 family RNA polymerase sigma factor [Proteobacteria bacterium]|nr:sigma-70 family RNA polymerase sigma factor [Pseudomonadota bacterium]